MATTGAALFPGSATFPGSTTYPGGGTLPQVEVLYTTDDASEATPAWSYVPVGDLRGYSVSRGRPDERSTVDAGTATISLDNRARLFDPFSDPLLTPMNRWWIRTKFGGVTEDRFLGYADRYELTWPEKGKDSQTIVSCTDEMKILNLTKLPSFAPPDATDYAAVVGADDPSGYWRWSNPLLMTTTIVDTPPSEHLWFIWRHDPDRATWTPEGTRTVTTEGQGWRLFSGGSTYAIFGVDPVAIVGDPENITVAEDEAVSAGGYLGLNAVGRGLDASDTLAGDMLSAFSGTVECWFMKQSNPGVDGDFWKGPRDAAPAEVWIWRLHPAGTVEFFYRTSSATYVSVISAALANNVWYHLVATLDGTNLRLYVNGVNVSTTASALAFSGASTVTPMRLQYPSAPVFLDEMAVYAGKALSATRIQDHYTAATARGFPAQTPSDRVAAILDVLASAAPRSLRTSSRGMYPVFMAGAVVLDMLRTAETCEAPDGFFFCSHSGVLTLLDAAHRSSSPWSTSQMTFDDDGTDNPYLDATAEVNDSLIVNRWNLSKGGRGKATQTVSDATSISRYRTREQTISDLPVTLNSDVGTIAAAYLSKYKDPIDRVPQVRPDMSTTDTAVAALARELGDQVTITRRPLGGGGAITQSAWIQAISESGSPGQPIDLTFTVSPV